MYLPAVNQVLHDRHAKPSPLIHTSRSLIFLRKWLKDIFEKFFCHSNAGISDLHLIADPFVRQDLFFKAAVDCSARFIIFDRVCDDINKRHMSF